ncbi:MAG: acyl carrier protein [Nannocystaceae bacterium]
MNEDIATQVRAIIRDQLEIPEEVTDDKSFTEDLGADSLAIVELVLALEEKFGIKIPDERVDEIKTVGDAVDYIRNNIKR